MHSIDIELIENHIKKLQRVFSIIICLISLVELILMVRGFLVFNLERPKLRMYLYSYIFLFVTSLATFIILILCKDKPKYKKLIITQTYLYAFCLMCWATFVSIIDSVANGDSGIIVYVMTAISVGVLILIKPIFFAAMLTLTGGGLLTATYLEIGSFFSSGFYINFFVFFALALFINMHNYHLSKREYETGKRLQQLSYTDQLTNVYNRRQLDKHIASFANKREQYLFVLLDVDNFKAVNDTHGHAVGDECLVLIAQTLCAAFGKRVYRFGGDEFAIISQLESNEVCRLLDQINQTLKHTFQGIDLHISAGIYQTAKEDSPGTVFIRTDRALYRAKQNGKSMWAIYERD